MRRYGSGGSRMLRRSECAPKTARREHRVCPAPPAASRAAPPLRTAPPAERPTPRRRSDGAAEPGEEPAARASSARAGRRWAPSPTLGVRELALVALGGVLLAVLTTWPLVLHMPSRIAPDLGDPVRTAWEVAWVGHAMLHSPLHLFDANAFYPHPLSLAFSDSLLGYGPAGALRLGHRRRARPLQPAVPVRLVAVLLRRLPARARAGAAAGSARPRRGSRSPTRPTASPRPGTCT